MPVSEAQNDLIHRVRVRFATPLTDVVGGVRLVEGAAQNGITPREAERLQAIFGSSIVEIVGPWEDPPSEPATPVAEDDDAGEGEEEGDADDAPEGDALPLAPPPGARPARRRKRPR